MTAFVLPFWRPDRGECQERLSREKIISRFSGRVPKEWGERVEGVKTRLNTDQRVLAFTFDACGGSKGSGYDAKLMEYLEREHISATLFISGKWIDANPSHFKKLSENPLFEIENHGLNHQPCSSTGRSIYGMKGTKNVDEIYDEIELNALKIFNLTGRKPKYYRPGAAFCDEICIEIANALGYEVVNFNVRGDAGATYSKGEVKRALRNAPPSSIILMHMNQPEKETAEGFMEAFPELKKAGFRFTKLSEFPLR
ncbi:MAG: polysaccharide deacetylase family protein [Syntrophaceae bacterium]|nr:polysaccharide deacetylase family protein [Syntrophaceae bacterium]